MSDLTTTIQHAVPLAPLTTLKLGGPAAHFVQVAQPEQVEQAVAWAARERVPMLLLGGGSNLVVADAGFGGLVVQMRTRGTVEIDAGECVEVQVAAGEPWDAFVAYAAQRGWAGVECLAGIPGSVGATPIQNVGAYGQDVSQTIVRVRVLDRKTLQTQWLATEALAFGYRDSWLRRNPEAYVVLDVVFRLRRGAPHPARYAELAEAMANRETPSVEQIRQAVIHLRRRKSMVLDSSDPNTTSAGSFFTNPVVDQPTAKHVVDMALQHKLVSNASQVPQWPVPGGQVKLAAGWLIENAGFTRGYRHGAVGISSAHALALVHHGGGTTQALIELARLIRSRVENMFNVRLTPEPIFVGVSL